MLYYILILLGILVFLLSLAFPLDLMNARHGLISISYILKQKIYKLLGKD
jgi:hypothetical protein